MPDVSVVIPTHNRPELLARALRCALSQGDVTVEVVVVDDGSAADTATLLASTDDPRVRVLRHDVARGLSAARNAGIAAARGEWVAFFDDDDLWAPEKLSAQLAALRGQPGAEWCCTGAVAVDDSLRIIGPGQTPPPPGDVTAEVLSRSTIPSGGSSVVARVAAVREVGGFDEGLRSLEDWDLWVRLALRSPLAVVARPLVAYRVNPASMAHDRATMDASYEILASRYASVREARGVRLADASWLKYMGAAQLRSGRRLAAARTHLRLATRFGVRRGWLLAVAGLVVPGIQARRDARQARVMPSGWREEADRWLEPLRSIGSR